MSKVWNVSNNLHEFFVCLWKSCTIKKNVQTNVPYIKQKLQSKITISDNVPFVEDISQIFIRVNISDIVHQKIAAFVMSCITNLSCYYCYYYYYYFI